MPRIEIVSVPHRSESVQKGTNPPSLRYISYFENLTKNVNAATSVVGSTTYEINSATHTTTGNEVLVCTVPCTITLNANPLDEEEVVVKRLNGQVQILGNGKLIDTYTDGIIDTDGTCLVFLFSTLSNKWVII